MIGRTNAISGSNVKLFTPSAVITGSTLRITDRNGDFCSGFAVYDDEEFQLFFDVTENVIYLPEHFDAGCILKIVSKSNYLQDSDVLRIRYDEEEA